MEAFALYLLKSSVWLTGFATIYFLFLRNERFFTLNRIFLISGILISVAFPFFTWHYTVVFPVAPTVNLGEPQIQAVGVANDSSFQAKDLLLYIYIFGVSYLIFRLIKQTLSVWQQIRKSKPLHFNSVKLIRTNRYPASFSFFSFVFVNPSTHEHEINEIVNHEQEHIRQRHWIDLLLFEILCTVQWINPVVWIYGRFIRQNHEFMADEQALRRTTNPAIYRAALLNQMFGAPVISLANSFNYSINKKRFNMMKQATYSPFRKLKLLLVLPLIAGVFYAFATPEYKFVQAKNEPTQTEVVQSTGEIFQTELNEGAPAISENQKESPQKQSIANSSTVSPTDGKMIRGKVISEDGKPLRGTSIIISGTTIGTMPDENGSFKLKATDDSPIVFSFVGFQTQKLKPDFDKEMLITMKRAVIGIDAVGNDPSESEIVKIPGPVPYLFIVDGKEISREEMEKIHPSTIASISVLKQESATILYGEKGKNGVILITMKKEQAISNKNEKSEITVVGSGKVNQDSVKPTSEIRVRSFPTYGNPLIVIDGTISPDKKVEDINPETIQSINVLKGEKATQKYGEKGKDGAVEITLKKEKEVFIVVEQMPEFPGGIQALKIFVAATLKYPVIALEKGIQGQVYVGFVVAEDGSVTNAKIERGVDPSLDKEALRIVNSMPKWSPGKQRGMSVKVNYTIPINFKLPPETISKEKLH